MLILGLKLCILGLKSEGKSDLPRTIRPLSILANQYIGENNLCVNMELKKKQVNIIRELKKIINREFDIAMNS